MLGVCCAVRVVLCVLCLRCFCIVFVALCLSAVLCFLDCVVSVVL